MAGKVQDDLESERERHLALTTIDQLVDDLGLKRLDLLKIDIDGYDLRALLGATATIEKFMPLIYRRAV